MAGNRLGGKKAAATILASDPDFYRKIGAKGGKAKVPKGFALLDREQRSRVSAMGGSAPKTRRAVETS